MRRIRAIPHSSAVVRSIPHHQFFCSRRGLKINSSKRRLMGISLRVASARPTQPGSLSSISTQSQRLEPYPTFARSASLPAALQNANATSAFVPHPVAQNLRDAPLMGAQFLRGHAPKHAKISTFSAWHTTCNQGGVKQECRACGAVPATQSANRKI